MARRYALRDDQWERLKALLPGRPETVGMTAKDNRLFVDAVIYRYRAGIPWRDLPERFGDWKNIHRRHRRWNESGTWEFFGSTPEIRAYCRKKCRSFCPVPKSLCMTHLQISLSSGTQRKKVFTSFRMIFSTICIIR